MASSELWYSNEYQALHKELINKNSARLDEVEEIKGKSKDNSDLSNAAC